MKKLDYDYRSIIKVCGAPPEEEWRCKYYKPVNEDGGCDCIYYDAGEGRCMKHD